MGSTRHHPDRRPVLGRLLESNEYRLCALDRQGIQVTVDGPTVLEFLFDRIRATGTARDFRLNWMLNVAGLLNELQTGYTAFASETASDGQPPMSHVNNLAGHNT